LKTIVSLGALCIGTAIFAGCAGNSGSVPASPVAVGAQAPGAAAASNTRSVATGNAAYGHSHKVCGDAPAGSARCHSLVRDDLAPTHLASDAKPDRRPAPSPAPSPTSSPVTTPTPGATATPPSGTPPPCTHNSGINGFQPCELQKAYNLTSFSTANGASSTVAIVDAYDDPNAEADLANYRSTFGLPACTTANGCFRKVNQTGGTTYPTANASWGQEISLDLDMVSAICPNCKILLVEGTTSSNANLAAAVDEAAALGATSISNSYGSAENTAYDSHYNNHPGITVTASSGDSGYGTQSPASAVNVVAVGGTALTAGGTRPGGYSETAWTSAGSGCSTSNAKPAWQTFTACGTFRGEADVSAVADPNTGVAVYDSFGGGKTATGWLVFGGTSVASPIIGAVYGLAHTGESNASKLYSNANALFDVTSGSNGSCGAPVCTAGAGWDGPTGLGSPNGIAAF